MKKKLGLGAGFALTAAAIAIGCGSKKTTIITGSSGELGAGNFPASSISTNNLAADGGGFSENNQTASFTNEKCVFNTARPDSDGPNSGADNSAMIFFATTDNGSTAGHVHWYLSNWNGSSFTPPVEVTGVDRDDTLNTTPAVVMVPMNTTGSSNALVSANKGNWAIFIPGQTKNTVTNTSVVGAETNTVGPHLTYFSFVFIKSNASQPVSTTHLIGNTLLTGTPNGPATELHYGFQVLGPQISPFNNGVGTGSALPGGGTGFVDGGGNIIRPAEDIASLAVVTDTWVHCASFRSSVNDVSGMTPGTNGTRIGNANGGKFKFGGGGGGPVFPEAADYTPGDNTTFIQLFWVQLITSGSSAPTGSTLSRTSTTFAPTASPGTVQLGPQWQLLTSNFSLASMTLGNVAAVNAPVTRNTFTDGRKASTQPLANLTAYNNILFWNYVDTSLQVPQTGGTGSVEGTIDSDNVVPGGGTTASASSVILSTVAVLPHTNGDGGADIGNQEDITLLGSAGRHNTTNSTDLGTVSKTYRGEEFVSLGLCSGCGVLGPDEGQVDITAFVLGQVTTFTANGGGTLNDIDTEIWAVALNATGATAGTLETMTNNPKRVVAGVGDIQQPSSTNGFTLTSFMPDSVSDVKMQSSRDGTYDVLAWRQAQGTSQQANLALSATVYKVFRTVANTQSATVTVPSLDQRFAAAPIVVNTASNVAYTTATVLPGAFTGSPVAAYNFEGHMGYKCGFQGDRTKMSIIWLYSDGTEDRIFVKLLTIGTGTLVTDVPTIAGSNETELDASAALVPGQGVNNLTTIHKENFRFLPTSFKETIPGWSATNGANNVNCSTLLNGAQTDKADSPTVSSFDSLDSVDAGVNSAGTGGDVLIVFSKIVAATTNNWDRQIIAALYNQTTISDRVVISRNFAESTGTGPIAFVGYGGVPSSFFKTNLYNLTPNTESASISTANRSPDNGTYIYFGAPVNANITAARGLYTRHFRARTATGTGGTAVTFANTFFPAAAATPTTDAVRIDQASENSDANYVGTLQKGRQAIVLFGQDNHFWGTQTSDGETYTNTNGLASAMLIDNNFSANQTAPTPNAPVIQGCVKTDSNCDNLSGTILVIKKQDVNLNDRFYVRVMQ